MGGSIFESMRVSSSFNLDETLNMSVDMTKLQSLKFSARYLERFLRKTLDKENRKSTISPTGSDVLTSK